MQSTDTTAVSNAISPVFASPVIATRRARPVYCGLAGRHVERYEFDAEYVRRLTEGDPSVEEHFASYFSPLIRIKLRRHGWPAEDVEDIRQDTFMRVLQTLREKGGLQHPERLGAFVYSVCNNVALEFRRARGRHPNADPDAPEPADTSIDVHGDLVAEERKKLVRLVLDGLPESDRLLLRRIFLEEASRQEICRQMNVDRDYLRVLLHRALMRFKALAKTTALAAGA
jgi:RNA polymerase sigma-70 factor, ECF subfamily